MNTLASAAEVPLSGVHQIRESAANQCDIRNSFNPCRRRSLYKELDTKNPPFAGGFSCLLCFSRPGETRAKIERLKIAIYFVSQLLLNHTLVGKTVSTIFTIATSSPQFGPSTILITSPLIFL